MKKDPPSDNETEKSSRVPGSFHFWVLRPTRREPGVPVPVRHRPGPPLGPRVDVRLRELRFGVGPVSFPGKSRSSLSSPVLSGVLTFFLSETRRWFTIFDKTWTVETKTTPTKFFVRDLKGGERLKTYKTTETDSESIFCFRVLDSLHDCGWTSRLSYQNKKLVPTKISHVRVDTKKRVQKASLSPPSQYSGSLRP